jgi:hypothetical protein
LVEEQINVKVFAIEREALLPRQESKAASELQDEPFHFAQDGGFEISLLVCVLQSKEVEKIGVSQNQVCGDPILIAQCGHLSLSNFGGPSGERSPFIPIAL